MNQRLTMVRKIYVSNDKGYWLLHKSHNIEQTPSPTFTTISINKLRN